MNEARWLTENNVYQMTKYLRDEHGAARKKAGRRKLRLFNAACFRLIWPALGDLARRVVEMLEREADGLPVEGAAALKDEVAVEFDKLTPAQGFHYYCTLALRQALSSDLGWAVEEVTIRLSYAQRETDAPHRDVHPEFIRPWEETQDVHAALAREVFGNPFRPLPKRKFPAELRGLAQACYEDPAHYPLLADALADIGEDEAAAHCRLPDHVKGCHVVDWVLGKA
jgi:hypothetical protein